jgi:hypothetical protein
VPTKAKKKKPTKKKAKKKGKAATPKRLTKKEINAAVKSATKDGEQQHLKGMLDEKDKRIYGAARRVTRANSTAKRARDEVASAKLALLKLMQKRKGHTYDDGELRVYLDMKEAVKVEESTGRKKKRKQK